MPPCGLVVAMLMSIVGVAVAQEKALNADESKKPGSAEKATEDLPRKLSDEEKSFIELEVQRRLKEALDAAKPAAAAPQDKDQGAKIEELDRKVNEVIEAQKKVRPSEFNPAIGLVGETVFSYRNRGNDQTGSDRPGGFDIWQRSVELNIAAAVDPFFRGYAVVNASADAATGEATLGVEEASLVSTSLPLNLTLQAGRFFGEIGRLEYIHDHELPFVNRPLPLDQYIGGESRTDGIQLNWLIPIEHYVSVTAGLGDGIGGDAPASNPGAKRGWSELTFWGRASTYFDLTDDWQLETGLSGLLNNKEEDRGGFLADPANPVGGMIEKKRKLFVWDLKVSYVPLQTNQFTGLVWGTELLWSDNRYLMDPDGSLNPNPGPAAFSGDEFLRSIPAMGAYTYLTYKWDRQWSGGVLFEFVENQQDHNDKTAGYSAYITWATSHWNQIRLQFTHTDHNHVGEILNGVKDDNAIYIQWAWIIGAHSHGWTQR
jgi:hypothetical protein